MMAPDGTQLVQLQEKYVKLQYTLSTPQETTKDQKG